MQPTDRNKKNWLNTKELLILADMLKAVSHPSRIAIMVLLAENENKRMTVKEIYLEMNMSQPIISRHLGILRNAALVKRIVEGSQTYYELCEKSKNAKLISNCLSSLTK